MQLNVFATDDGSRDGSGPILLLPLDPQAVLPPHPRSLEWRYFATIEDKDNIPGTDRDAALSAIEDDGYYIAHRLISTAGS